MTTRSARQSGRLAMAALMVAAAVAQGSSDLVIADDLEPGVHTGFLKWLGEQPEEKRAEFSVGSDDEGSLTLEMIVSGPPEQFRDVNIQNDKLTFTWGDYDCELEQKDRAYEGICKSESGDDAVLTIDPPPETAPDEDPTDVAAGVPEEAGESANSPGDERNIENRDE